MRVCLATQPISIPPLLLLTGLLLTSCRPRQNTLDTEIPLVPVELVTQGGGVIPWRAPLHVKDEQLQLAEFTETGERAMHSYDEITFPTDVLIVFSAEPRAATVFLRRSPHGGCLLLWDPESSLIHDPCFGSRFDITGQLTTGPSRRNLDQLPATIRDGIVWVTPQITYGEVRQ